MADCVKCGCAATYREVDVEGTDTYVGGSMCNNCYNKAWARFHEVREVFADLLDLGVPPWCANRRMTEFHRRGYAA